MEEQQIEQQEEATTQRKLEPIRLVFRCEMYDRRYKNQKYLKCTQFGFNRNFWLKRVYVLEFGYGTVIRLFFNGRSKYALRRNRRMLESMSINKFNNKHLKDAVELDGSDAENFAEYLLANVGIEDRVHEMLFITISRRACPDGTGFIKDQCTCNRELVCPYRGSRN